MIMTNHGLNAEEYFTHIDPSVVDPLTSTVPTIQWTNGDSREKENTIAHTGGWFISEQQAPGELTSPFEPYTLITASGKEVPGYAARDITIAVVRKRFDWIVSTSTGTQRFRTYPEAEAAEQGARPRGHVQLLVAVNHLEAFGAFMISAKGMASKALGDREGVLGVLNKTLRAPARSMGRQVRGRAFPGLPWHAFWITLGPERHADGTPKYTRVGPERASRMITGITALNLPEKPVTSWEALTQYLVPRDTLSQFDEIYHLTADWEDERHALPAPAKTSSKVTSEVAGSSNLATFEAQQGDQTESEVTDDIP